MMTTTPLPAPSGPGQHPAQQRRAPHDQRRFVLSLVSMAAVILASLSLNGVIQGWLWLPSVALTIGSVFAGMAVVRRLRFPDPLIFVTGLLTLVGTLNWQYFPDQSILGVIPGPEFPERLTFLLKDAEDTVVSQLAPVLPGVGILLIISATTGLMAILVDTLAITLRMPAVSGILLLVILVPPAIIKPDGVGMPAFVAAATGYLLLLAAGQWREKPEKTASTGRTSDGFFTRAVSIGAVALTAALVLPLMIPGFNSGTFPQGSRLNPWGTATGLNPSVTLGNDLRNPAGFGRITYATNADEPLYLRSSTLEDFSGQRWEPDQRLDSRRTGIRAMEGNDRTGSTVVTTITTGSFTSTWLLAPYAPTSITNVEGSWSWDPQNLTILASDGGSTAQQTYQVRSSTPKLTRELLAHIGPVPDGEVSPEFMALPDNIPAAIETTARGLTAETANPFYKAMAIQNYLRGEDFTYSLEAPVEGGYDGNSMGVIERFLDVKAGYCVQFAGTMAVMARLVGIPSRVAVGYAPGTPTGNTIRGPHGEELTEFAVDSRDAHAWPELYFRDVGWVKFEPTPGRGVVPGYAQAQPLPPEVLAEDNLTPQDSSVSAAQPPSTSGSGAADDLAGPDRFRSNWVLIAGTLLLLLALISVTPLLRREARSSRRRRLLTSGTHNPARIAWAETTEIAGDYGYPTVPSDTPRTFAERLRSKAALEGQAAVSLSRLQHAYEIEEFAQATGSPRQAAGTLHTWEDVQTVISALRSAAKPATRLKAQLLPYSLRHPFGTVR
ncbi:transglutaminase family protein [Crystallibacter degradans]|uniref:transglutaminase family protein n=1 Tax=Crystallibacter degradans TaxID=2726743 RepID=UPI0014728539|nr:DUF3488 and transglutaminase-like domain-containing protein [Arthrobacter sp. SF27]NMR31214.1 transglutaminase domain-containing protein [Arthrobacter sp. SF27]